MNRRTSKAPLGAVPTLVGTIAVCAILYFGREVLIPLALAALISFVLAPLVRRLERRRVPAGIAVALVGSLAAVPVVGTGWVVASQTAALIESLPTYRDTFRAKISDIRDLAARASGVLDTFDDVTDNTDAGPLAEEPPQPVTIVEPTPLPMASRLMAPILAPIATLVMVMFFAVFILLERDRVRDRLIALLNRNRLTVTSRAIDEVTERVGRYLRRQILINAGNGLITAIALSLLGVPNALLWGILGGVLRFIPYLGPLIAGLFPTIVAFVVSDSWTLPLSVAAFFICLEIVGDFVEPLIQRSSTGVTSLALLLAAAFWAWIWGIPGLLLSTPLTVCLVVAGQHAPPLRWLWIALADQSPLTPPESLYRRIISGEPPSIPPLTLEPGAALAETADNLLLPVLLAARRDLHRGDLDEQRFRTSIEAVRTLIPAPGATPDNPMPPVLCIPAHDEADAAAAQLLTAAFLGAGIPAISISAEDLGSPLEPLVRRAQAAHACVVALPPYATHRARLRLRQLERRVPGLAVSVLLPATPHTLQSNLQPARTFGSITEAVRSTWTAESADQRHPAA